MARYIDLDMVEYLIDHYGGMVTWNKKEILGEIKRQAQIHSTADVVPKSEVEKARAEAITEFAERLKQYRKYELDHDLIDYIAATLMKGD